MDESRRQFEQQASRALNLPVSLIEQARKGSGYDHSFDSMSLLQPLNGWWVWWQASRQAIEITSPEPITTREALDAGYMGDYAAGRDDGIEDTLKVVRAAGLKIKGGQ